jgi:hypothetical protein
MNVAGFVLWYPEFAQVAVQNIQSALNRAAIKMGGPASDIWGSFATAGNQQTQADEAQAALAAHILVSTPLGGPTKLKTGDGRSSYLERFEELLYARAGGMLVAGGPRGIGGYGGGPGFPWC